jgi:hypothetical protein
MRWSEPQSDLSAELAERQYCAASAGPLHGACPPRASAMAPAQHPAPKGNRGSIDRSTRQQTPVQGLFREHAVLGGPLTQADLAVHQAPLRLTQCPAGSRKTLEVDATVPAPHEARGFAAAIGLEYGSWGLVNCWRALLAHPESRALIDTPS